MKATIPSLLLACFFLLFIEKSYSQKDQKDTIPCPVKDFKDILRGKDTLKIKATKNNYLLITPVVGSSPATGFILGIAGQYTFKGPKPEDKYSIVNANAQYTTKNQLLIQAKNNLLLFNNRLYCSGDWRVFIYSQPTYGLGTGVLNAQEGGGIILADEFLEPDSLAQPMKFNYYKFHQTAAYNFKGLFYFGGGIHFDIYNSIKDEDLNLAAGDTTYHYSYSTEHNFNPEKYTLNGISASAIIDTRDNQLNAYTGWFLNLNFRYNPKLSSSQKNSTMLFAEMRHFETFKVKRHQHTIGFWVWANLVTGGEVPYLTLPAVGWDQRSRSGRGYPQGMFRGDKMIYGEFEYRFPLICNGFLGGVVFVNAVTASNKDADEPLFRYIRPAFGAGLRLLMDKSSRTNLVIDYGKGKKSNGFYLNGGETF